MARNRDGYALPDHKSNTYQVLSGGVGAHSTRTRDLMTFIEPRRAVSDFILANYASVVTPLGGRLYPNAGHPRIVEITTVETPECYVAGILQPTALVVDDGENRLGVHRLGAEIYFRILIWQWEGRDIIDEMAEQLGIQLQDQVLTTLPGAYYFQWAGRSPSSLSDPSQNNAPMAWVRFQMARILR